MALICGKHPRWVERLSPIAIHGGTGLPVFPVSIDERSRVSSHESLQAFGPSLLPEKYARGELGGMEIGAERLDSRKILRENAPTSPGIYGYFDQNGRLNYVGKSKCLKMRLLSYFSKLPSDDKMARIVRNSKFIRWEPISHELLALIREQELITRWRPSFNRQGQPERRQPAFLCISDRDAPHVVVSTRISSKTRNGFGPIPGTGRLKESAQDLNHVFRLRDCNAQTPIRFTDQLQLFPQAFPAGCIRYEIGSCSGPCTGTFPQNDYRDQVKRLNDFMSGYENSVLSSLQQEMVEASKNHAFEKATMLRDQIRNLTWLDRRLNDLRRARYDFNGIYPVTGFRKRTIWLCLSSSLISSAVVLPTGKRLAAHALKQIDVANSVNQNPLPQDHPTVLMQMILISWFRKNPDERNRLLSYPEAISVCENRISR